MGMKVFLCSLWFTLQWHIGRIQGVTWPTQFCLRALFQERAKLYYKPFEESRLITVLCAPNKKPTPPHSMKKAATIIHVALVQLE